MASEGASSGMPTRSATDATDAEPHNISNIPAENILIISEFVPSSSLGNFRQASRRMRTYATPEFAERFLQSTKLRFYRGDGLQYFIDILQLRTTHSRIKKIEIHVDIEDWVRNVEPRGQGASASHVALVTGRFRTIVQMLGNRCRNIEWHLNVHGNQSSFVPHDLDSLLKLKEHVSGIVATLSNQGAFFKQARFEHWPLGLLPVNSNLFTAMAQLETLIIIDMGVKQPEDALLLANTAEVLAFFSSFAPSLQKMKLMAVEADMGDEDDDDDENASNDYYGPRDQWILGVFSPVLGQLNFPNLIHMELVRLTMHETDFYAFVARHLEQLDVYDIYARVECTTGFLSAQLLLLPECRASLQLPQSNHFAGGSQHLVEFSSDDFDELLQ